MTTAAAAAVEGAKRASVARDKKKEVGTHTKCTLFLRNLAADVSNKDLEEFFSEWGPVRSAFTVREKEASDAVEDKTEQKKDAKGKKGAFRGIGFVHFALAEDARRALEAVGSGAELKGRTFLAELALRKSAKPAEPLAAKKEASERPLKRVLASSSEAAKSPVATKRPKKAEDDSSLVIKVGKGGEKLDFDKKQLFKKVRKCGQLVELVYPYKENMHMARLLFKSPKEAEKASTKLDKHIFKGHLISVCSRDHTPDIKHHRLIVRNLSFHATAAEVKEAFSAFGNVLQVTLPTKPGKEGLPRGFAFVQMESREEATKAMEELNGKEICKRMVAIDWALNKTVFEKLQSEEKSQQVIPELTAEDNAAQDETLEGEPVRSVPSKAAPKNSPHRQKEQQNEEDQDEEEHGHGDEQEADKEPDAGADDEQPELSTTVFIRNVSFATEESDILEALSAFGKVEYCKVVRDPQTGTSKGTAFAKFYEQASASAACQASEEGLCQDQLDYQESTATTNTTPSFVSDLDKSLMELGGRLDDFSRKRTGKDLGSIISPSPSSPLVGGEQHTGRGVIVDGRALMIVPAVDRKSAARLKKDHSFLDSGPQDRRNLCLLNETAIKAKTSTARRFWPVIDVGHHDQVLKDRRRELKNNPNLFLSTTRLSIRHLPPSVTESQLKLVLRTAVRRARMLNEEDEGYPIVDSKMLAGAAKDRPILKQVKIVRATPDRKSKSKGYGFAEWTHPVHALLCLRYLTNYKPDLWKELLAEHFSSKRHLEKGEIFRAKAPLVEFSTEKATVVTKRNERLMRSKSKE